MVNWIDIELFISVLMVLFAIMDPPGTIPIFISLTAKFTAKKRNNLAFQALLVASGVIFVFAIFGQSILNYMQISFPALQGAGGFLLLLIALQLLTGETTKEDGIKYKNVAFVPLGTPLMAGPGAIVAVMLFVQQSSSRPEYISVILGVIITLLALYFSMRFAGIILKILGENGVELITRIAGVLLSAIAVQMIADAIIGFAI